MVSIPCSNPVGHGLCILKLAKKYEHCTWHCSWLEPALLMNVIFNPRRWNTISCLMFATPVVWRCGQASSGGGVIPYAYQWWFFWSQWLPWPSYMGRSWGNYGANTAFTRLCSEHYQVLRSTRSLGQSKDILMKCMKSISSFKWAKRKHKIQKQTCYIKEKMCVNLRTMCVPLHFMLYF